MFQAKKLQRRFNPAEAEEWFRSVYQGHQCSKSYKVSIQPKPKNGLEEFQTLCLDKEKICFNPAEAEEWFRRILIFMKQITMITFQSSRSRRMV